MAYSQIKARKGGKRSLNLREAIAEPSREAVQSSNCLMASFPGDPVNNSGDLKLFTGTLIVQFDRGNHHRER